MPDLAGRDCSAHCVAPNLGWLSYRMPVANAATYLRELRQRNVEPYTALRRLRIAPYGELDIFSVRTPDGAIIEFFSTTGQRRQV